MQSDEEAQGMAYYIRFAAILGVELVRGLPCGFDQQLFEALWLALEKFVREERGLRLAMPVPGRLRKYVAYPMVHVLLRKLDLERLPEFFLSSGFPPRTPAAVTTLEHSFTRWASTHLTAAGAAALADERKPGVIAQVAAELEQWDGAVVDSQTGRASATVDILLDLPRSMPVFEYIARRLLGFPEVFECGDRVFQASEAGWYEATPVPPDDGPLLAEGFAWEVAAPEQGRRYALRRAAVQCIAFVAGEEYTGLVSYGALKLHSKGAVLCVDQVLPAVSAYLAAVCGRTVTPVQNCPTVPKGWHLFVFVKPTRFDVPVPAGLEALSIRSETDITVSGGLRLGRRSSWLTVAPPTLSITGDVPRRAVAVNGTEYRVADDGTVPDCGVLSQAGTHIVEAGGTTRRIELLVPFVAPEVYAPPELAGEAPHILALPPGQWSVIGPTPGQLVDVPASAQGALARPLWPPAAALSVGRKEPLVLFLGAIPPPPFKGARRGRVSEAEAAWAHAICNAAIRRPPVASLVASVAGFDAVRRWVEYVKTAGELKRRCRRGRR